MNRYSTWLVVGALFLSALAPRLYYLWESRQNPFFDAPVVDAQTFLVQAQSIADGELWGGPDPFWQPPFYTYFLAFFCWLFPASYFIAIRLVHAVFGALSCLLVYVLARRAFGERVGRIAGAISALCGSFIYFEGELLAVPVEIFLNLLLLNRLVAAFDRRNSDRHWLVAGLIAGLAALTRPNVLLFTAAYCAWLYWCRRHETRRRALILFMLPVALVVLPVSWRNWVAEPDLVLISANGGVNFYIGNNAAYQRTVALHPGMAWEKMVMEPVRLGHTTAAAKSAFFLRKSLSYIAANPIDYLGLLLHKGMAFWQGPETKRNQDIYYARKYSHILSVLLWDRYLSLPFGLLGPLALLGLALSIRERDPPVAVLRLYALSYIASVVLFFPVARYRMPVLPVLIVFAAFGAWCLYLSIRRKAWAPAVGQVVPLGALLILCNLTAAPLSAEDAQLHFDLGEVHLRKGDYTLAERYSRRAVELDPNYNYARHNLAVAYFHQSRYKEGEKEALATSAQNPNRSDTQVLLGQIYFEMNKSDRAATYLQRALTTDPESVKAHYYYARLLYRQERYQSAADHFALVVPSLPDDFWLHYQLGRALHQAGHTDAALHRYQQALAIDRRAEVLVAIGALHLLAQSSDEAGDHFRQALELDPHNPEAHVNLALLDLEDGRPQAAVDRLQQVLARGDVAMARRLLVEARRRMGRQ